MITELVNGAMLMHVLHTPEHLELTVAKYVMENAERVEDGTYLKTITDPDSSEEIVVIHQDRNQNGPDAEDTLVYIYDAEESSCNDYGMDALLCTDNSLNY